MSIVRIPKEEYKKLLLENAELKYQNVVQKSEVERLEKTLIRYEAEIYDLKRSYAFDNCEDWDEDDYTEDEYEEEY